MKGTSIIVSVCCSCLIWNDGVQAQSKPESCLQTEAALNYWRPIRESAPDNSQSPDQLATELVSCLGSPNSELRDIIGYELLTFWLRSDALSRQTKIDLLETLSLNLQQSSVENSLSRSFSALILSELLRADNLSGFMTDEVRLGLLQITVNALSAETDFRGLEKDIGWVHPIAHMADMLWRYALHSELNQEMARLVLRGVRSKAATSATSYTFNEGDRLARPVSVLIVKGILSESEITEWLNSFSTPAGKESWAEAFQSSEGMSELHNSKLFIRALSDQLRNDDISEGIRTRLDELVELFTSIV